MRRPYLCQIAAAVLLLVDPHSHLGHKARGWGLGRLCGALRHHPHRSAGPCTGANHDDLQAQASTGRGAQVWHGACRAWGHGKGTLMCAGEGGEHALSHESWVLLGTSPSTAAKHCALECCRAQHP